MRLLARISVVLLFVGVGTSLLALQDGGYLGFPREATTYPGEGSEKSEYAWSRLRYDAAGGGLWWLRVRPRGRWSTDYPKADRQFLMALRRLTRIQARPTEQVVDLDSDEIYNLPWVYAVQVQSWTFTEPQAKRLREYLLKGGFLMVDDFHGAADWESFMNGMLMVFPDRPIEDLDNKTRFSMFSMIWASVSRCRANNT